MSGTFLDTAQHARHFPDLMSVSAYTAGARNNRGVPEPGSWTTVPGLDAVPVLVVARQGDEVPIVDGGAKELAISTHEIITQDYYPQITHLMRGTVGLQVYEFVQCDHEGMHTVGIIKARRVNG